jgi:hypothetical protein
VSALENWGTLAKKKLDAKKQAAKMQPGLLSQALKRWQNLLC